MLVLRKQKTSKLNLSLCLRLYW